MNNIRVVLQPQQSPSVDSNLIEEIIPKEPLKEIPNSNLSLKSIKGFTEKKKSLKLLKLKTDTIIELKKAFTIFDKSEMHLNHSVILFVAQIVEDIFNKPRQGEIKKEVVIEVCKEYFNEDSALVEMVIELIFNKVIKTTLWRRNKQRVKNLAIFFLEIFGPSIQTNLSSRLKL